MWYFMNEELFSKIEKYNGLREIGKIEIPSVITNNIKNELRPYQIRGLQYFITHVEKYNDNNVLKK